MSRKHLWLLTAVFVLASALYFFRALIITEAGFPLDDSWIHQVFARNLATGHGFSFNPDIPISGATAPLWTLITALFWPLLGPIAGGIIPCLLLELLAILAIYKLAEYLLDSEPLALLVTVLSTLTWVLIWGALSGMEIGLYSALSLWGLYFYFKSQSMDDRRGYIAYGFFALAILARPECALFLAAAMLRDFFIWLNHGKRRLAPWIWRGAIVLLLLAPYFYFNYSVTGTFFPQTYNAKVRGKGLISAVGNGELKRIIKTLTLFPYYYLQDFLRQLLKLNPIILVAFFSGCLKFFMVRDGRRSQRIMLALLLILYVPLMGTFSPVLTATYHAMRLIDNIIPLIILVEISGLFWKAEYPVGKSSIYLSIGLLLLSLAGGILLLADDFIVRSLGPSLLQNIDRMNNGDYEILTLYVRDTGINSIFLALVLFAGIVIASNWIQNQLKYKIVKRIIITGIVAYSAILLIFKSGYYADNVRDINEIDKAVGIYLKEINSGADRLAVNDIGAIGYYSGMKILDLKGLVSPEIRSEMIVDDSLAFEYMLLQERVDYVAIFPNWFRYIPKRTDILKPIKYFISENSSILAGDTTIIYRADWPDSIL